jgi:hypothetical protein
MVPLLRCWKVLVPLKLVADFKNACSEPAKIAWSPELIEGVPNVVSDEDVSRDDIVQFRPP